MVFYDTENLHKSGCLCLMFPTIVAGRVRLGVPSWSSFDVKVFRRLQGHPSEMNHMRNGWFFMFFSTICVAILVWVPTTSEVFRCEI